MGSVDANRSDAIIHISEHGTDWLWAVFAVMVVSMLGMFALSYTRPRGTRFFHSVALIILTTSAIAYFSMASNLGSTPIVTEFRRVGTRQVWYVRYIQWFINFPLLLMVLLFSTGLALSDILIAAFFSWVVVISGLVGGLVRSSYKWGYYVFGLFAMFYVWTVLLGHGPRSTFNAGSGVRSGYIRGSGFVTFILMLYPIAWACSEGANVISPTSEAVWYGVLDLLLGPVFLFYFVFGLRNVDYATFGLQSWKYSDTGSAVVAPGAAPGIGGAATSHGIVHPKAAEAGVAPFAAATPRHATFAADPVRPSVIAPVTAPATTNDVAAVA